MGLGEQGKGVFQAEDLVDERGADGAEEGPGEVPHHVVGGGHLLLFFFGFFGGMFCEMVVWFGMVGMVGCGGGWWWGGFVWGEQGGWFGGCWCVLVCRANGCVTHI